MPAPILNSKGQLDAYSSVGCYPLYYLCEDASELCSECANGGDAHVGCPVNEFHTNACAQDEPAWCIVACDVNWEDPAMFCAHCSERIESAYAEDDAAKVKEEH